MERAMRGVNGQSGRGRGQGPQGHNTARGGGRGGGSNRGHHDGGRGRDLAMGSSHGGHRGRGRFDDEARAQIVSSRRPTTHQIASEGTDDIIVAAPAAEKAQHIASFILRKQDFKAFHDQRQIRTFVNSCLLNLSNHHSVDTSNILTDLSSRQGLARLKELILMPMHVDAGCEKSVLSFQYVILPLIGVLTRESVCLSTMTSETGVIYSMVYLHHRQFLTEGVLPCMDKLLERRSLRDYSAGGQRLLETDDSICRVASLQCALLAITRLVYQLIKRTKDARVEMAETVKKLKRQQECCVLVTENSSESRFTNEILTREVNRLQEIIIDAQDITIESIDSITNLLEKRANRARGPNMVNLAMAYDPPGHLSKDGPRHDNDKTEISQITLLPTMSEIICYRPPFLPSNDIPDAPHFIPPGWRRQLDIHFRLYREDLMDSLRKGVMGFLSALERIKKGQEGLLLKQKELRKHLDNNVSLNVYGNVQFMGLACTKQLSGSVEVAFAQPPQVVDSPKKRRMEFWERSRRRLMKGALVCIARRIEDRMNDDGLPFQMILGVITRRETDDLAKDEKFAHIHISLADPIQYITIIRSTTTQPSQEQWFLVESMGGFFESYRPILKALQLCMPASLPFGKYIAPSKADETVMQQSGNVLVDPPLYSRAPGFTFDLSVVLNGQQQRLDVSDPNSIMNSKRALQRYSTLDDTQAEALVETLCREVALISGPPGTGKTKIGVDLMEVLLHNKTAMNCGPILCICYTNHALDQFLEHLLDKKITKIVRVGARSKSERLEDYNLESLMKSRDRSFGVRQSLRTAHVAWENACEKVKKLEKALRSEELEWEYVEPYLFVSYPDLFEQFDRQPGYQGDDDELADDGFTVVGGKKVGGVYKRWISGVDIEDKRKANEKLIEDFRSQVQAGSNKFAALDSNFSRLRPRGPILHHIPDTNRPIHLLTGNIWDMSLKERERLQEKWRPEIQEAMVHELSNLLQQIEKADQLKSDAFDDIRRGILKETDVIGMTTNGAAKHQTLISAVAPKIIICEEAGEVLESHILATLSVSTQHLILIGDHLQLRPSIETYNLSTESAIGQNYNLDKSLFERLVTATNPLPMSHLTIQRRMRPEISSLIRNTLYPHLVDGERVFQYPPVNGLGANLFFMDHQHAEDSKDEYGMQSFANSFEVNMIEALAKYLIKNGYDKPGDIAVLTPYLGQLSKLRDKLRQSFMLMIDERDQEQLDMKDEEKGEGNTTSSLGINEHVGIKKIGLQSHLTLRTIDNYQGEEAKIVIISLVRSNVNDNGTLTGSSSIGFLKSPNRTNVLLSRAQHGMYIIGNAGLMENAKKGIWPQIMRELQQYDRIGDGFPLVCKNHPEAQNIVTEPDGFKIVSPNGGCTLSCGSNMPCGHVCPLHCHPDDMEHLLVKCFEACPRLHPICQHVCPKRCGEKCGNCLEIVAPLVLPCGHIYEQPRCWEAKDPSKIVCRVRVTRKLPTCEHEMTMECYRDPSLVSCAAPCKCNLPCGHSCTRPCSECQKASADPKAKEDRLPVPVVVVRTNHGKCLTKCGKNQFCGHACATKCHKGTSCPPCGERCEIACDHFTCKEKCDKPCAACCKRCTWACRHEGQCNMPCGAPCDRLPCNKRCEKALQCGHRCPSICGEKCPSKEFCVECKNPKTMEMIVDVIMQQSLDETDVNEDPILVMKCGHALTASSLDGMMEMQNYYRVTTDQRTGETTYLDTKSLPGEEVAQVACTLCRKPITGIYRYGRRIKYAQLSQRSKKFQVQQAKAMKEAKQGFDVAQARMDQNREEFIKSLAAPASRLHNDPPQPNEPPPETSCLLGKYSAPLAAFPNSDVGAIAIYGISEEHEKGWRKLIDETIRSLNGFKKIYKQSCASPTKRLFDAAVSHLYRIKTAPSFSPETGSAIQEHIPEGAQTASDVVQACIVECGLPRDGHGGSSFVDSLQECTNALIFILGSALAVLEKVGTSSGWYWFIGDLIRCASLHAIKFKEAALNGKYERSVAYSRIMHMELICKRAEWLGRKPLPSEENSRTQRLEEADKLQAEFMEEYQEIKTNCPLGIRPECNEKAESIMKKMVLAVTSAKGESIYTPVTDEEKIELIRAVEQTLHGTGRWYRCPNGHTYVIGECGMAMEQSRCPECGANVGGGHHTLLGDNTIDAEFERLRGRR